MKLVKSLLLGSAAGLCAVAGAQAADLPMRKAAPVEYVRVCTAYGAGFFYIPGTDTCLRVGGRARFEYSYATGRVSGQGGSNSAYRSLGRVSLDARTQTSYGTLRTFVRLDIASRTGGYLLSGTQQRIAGAFPGLGQDAFGAAQKYVEVDKAFIQFAGFTAGRAASFFDFYAHDVELIGNSVGSDVASTNLLAYTATFGNGLSATLSVEDPTFRRQPTYAPAFNAFLGTGGTTAIATRIDPITGLPTQAINLDVRQSNYMPDIIGSVRYEAPWGVAQVSAVVREIRTGNYTGTAAATDFGAKTGIVGIPTFTGPVVNLARPSAEYGYGVQGGLKINMPMVAPGDVLWLQAAYAKGGNQYSGVNNPLASYSQGTSLTNVTSGQNVFGLYDMAIDSNGKTHLTESWSVVASYLHYWTPELRSGVFGTYGQVNFDKALRGVASPLTAGGPGGTSSAAMYYPLLINGVSNATTTAFSGFGKDYSVFYAGANLIWSPVRDLDIGVEAIYQRAEFKNGKVLDSNKGTVYTAGPLAGFPTAVKSFDDQVVTRLRIQRDF